MSCYQNLASTQVTPFIYEYNVTEQKIVTDESQSAITSNITTELRIKYPHPVNKSEMISVLFKIDAPPNKPVSLKDVTNNMEVFDTTGNKLIGKVTRIIFVDNKPKMKIDFTPEFIQQLSK
jgi:hypothetical protein